MSNGHSNPSTWDDYERRGSPARTGSLSTSDGRHISFDQNNHNHLGQSPRTEASDGLHVRRRRSVTTKSTECLPSSGRKKKVFTDKTIGRPRSSVTNRLSALGDVGGVNSIRSFTRSWQRAAGFTEVIPQRPSFVFALDQEPIGAHDGLPYGRSADDELGASYGGPPPRVSLLRQHLEASSPEFAVRDDSPEPSGPTEAQPLLAHLDHRRSSAGGGGGSFHERERKALDNELRRTFSISSSSRGTPSSIFAVPPQLATPDIVGSYGSFRDYGTVASEDGELRSGSSMAEAGEMWRQQQTSGNVPDGGAPPILLKEVEQEDGKIVLTVKGQSTLPQTIFNSIK